MTEVNALKSTGIYELKVLKEANHEVIALGMKSAYRDRPQYKKVLDNDFARYKEFDHPNIFKYVELKETEDLGTCIIMEWEDCRPLSDYVAESHSEEEKKAIINQIAEALDYMHGRRCVHTALSPSVIFVTTKGDNVKILNFRQRYADGLKQPMDTLKFVAPEAKDGTVTLDARADIFSLGQVIKYLNMPLSYRPVIDECCSFGRNERFPDIDAFLSAFNHQKRSRADYHEGSNTGGGIQFGNKRKGLALVGVIAALVVLTAIWIFRQRSQADDDANAPQTEQVENIDANAANPTDSQTVGTNAANATPTTDVSFLDELMPQVKTDLDGIYAKAKGKKSLNKKVANYYKGLRKVLLQRGLNDDQLQAFDKAFGEYNAQKKAE